MSWMTRVSCVALGLMSASPVWGQVTTRVSVDSSGGQANDSSYDPTMTADGRYVSFWSRAGNLVPGDTNFSYDVFVHDGQTGQTIRVSVSSAGVQGNADSAHPKIAANGRYVVFESRADNLVPGDTNGDWDIFVHDLTTGQTILASLNPAGAQFPLGAGWPCISADGRYVAFIAQSGIYFRDLTAGTTTLASVDSSGNPANSQSDSPCISGDGRYVGFESDASNLVPGDTNNAIDGFVHDLVTGSTIAVDVDAAGSLASVGAGYLSLSFDGRFVAFASDNLTSGDTNGFFDVYVRDLVSGTTERVSLDPGGVQGNQRSFGPTSMSGDGRYVLYSSLASNLAPADTNGTSDVFLRDRQLGITTLESCSSSGVPGYNASGAATGGLSVDGRFVAFGSDAPNLVPGDTNDKADVFSRDRMPATVTSFCLGDGTGAPCPCGNSGGRFRGCENSASTGGSVLGASGVASLGNDTLRITSFGQRPSAFSGLSVYMQGDASVAPTNFGDGLLCIGGNLRRLYVTHSTLGVATEPQGNDPSISSRSAALGDTIPAGAARYYQVYYRDPSDTFCPNPPGNTWNASNALSAIWNP